MTGAKTVTDADHGLSLSVPIAAASGAATWWSTRDAVTHRIHIQTADGSEVYLEVTSYTGLIDHAAAAEQREALGARSPEARISEPSWTVVLDRPATTLDFSGSLGGTPRDRRFIFVDAAGRTNQDRARPDVAGE